MAEAWWRTRVAGRRPGARLILGAAAVLWLLLAARALRDLVSLRDLGILQGAFQDALYGLASLALAWLFVIGLSFAPAASGLRRLGNLGTRGLAMGTLAAALLTLWAVHGAITRAGGRAPSVYGFLLAAALPAGLAGVAARKDSSQDRPPGALRRWARRGGVALVAAVTLMLHLPVIGVRQCYLGESTAIAELRALLSAESAYQEASGGLFGPPDCLVAPSRCLPGYGPEAPTFLYAHLPVRCGYLFTFHPGPAGEGVNVRTFVITAVPTRVGVTGTRAFCGDSTFVLRSSPDGRLPESFPAGCPEALPHLQ